MTDFADNETFMVWLINLLAEKFPAQAILKGGMELRLLNCPRHTNDLDYVFIPFTSKNEIVEPVLTMLRAQKGLTVEHAMHSTCLRIIVSSDDARAQIEVNVASACKTIELSTADLARSHHQQGRIIRAMSLDVALSNKLAAWMERGLLRDLYDVYYMRGILGIDPDLQILTQRLGHIHYQPGKKPGPRTMSIPEFALTLREYGGRISSKDIRQELEDLVDPTELPGLELKIRAALISVAGFLEEAKV